MTAAPTEGTRERIAGAVGFSILVPGLGHWLAGERRSALLWFVTCQALLFIGFALAGGTQKEFKSLSIVLGKPSSTPGWGYAVEKDGADVDPGDAETLLQQFETGAIDLRKLFSELNVKLLSKDGGATMIPHAIVVRMHAPWVLLPVTGLVLWIVFFFLSLAVEMVVDLRADLRGDPHVGWQGDREVRWTPEKPDGWQIVSLSTWLAFLSLVGLSVVIGLVLGTFHSREITFSPEESSVTSQDCFFFGAACRDPDRIENVSSVVPAFGDRNLSLVAFYEDAEKKLRYRGILRTDKDDLSTAALLNRMFNESASD